MHEGCYAVDAGVEGWLRAVVGRLADPGRPWVTESTPAGEATSRPSLCRGADGRVAAEELLSELVQQMLRGPVQMLGVTVPRIAVGLAAVPPLPRADDAQGIDPDIGRTGGGIDHRGEHLSAALRGAGSGCRQQLADSVGAVRGAGRPCSGGARGLGLVGIAPRADTRRGVRLLPARPA